MKADNLRKRIVSNAKESDEQFTVALISRVDYGFYILLVGAIVDRMVRRDPLNHLSIQPVSISEGCSTFISDELSSRERSVTLRILQLLGKTHR
jgi:hypothetical protein